MKKGKGSVRWRLVLIYFLLVFIAMVVISVFLLNRIEAYQLSSLQQNIDSTVRESGMLNTLSGYDLKSDSAAIQKYLDGGFSFTTEEISIVDADLNVVASTNSTLVGRSAGAVFDAGIITSVLSSGNDEVLNSQTADGVNIMNLCYGISAGASQPKGVVYVRADLTDIHTLTIESRSLFIRATILALVITVVLGFILATNITEPINKVTETVEKMSKGDFSTEVPVRSNDEIGQLATMFNLMQGKLDATMGEIQGEKSKLEAILKYMADGLIAITTEGEIIHINRAARKMLGINVDEEIGPNAYESFIGHLSPELELGRVLNNSMEGETEFNFDYGGFTFAVRYDRFASEGDSPAGVLILLQDITERQKLEDMQKDFVANVSHELKTPLATVKAYTETLMDGGVDPETTDHFLEIINSEADRMNRLVKDLLQLSRLDHKQERWNIKEADIISLLSLCVEKMTPIAAQKKQALIARFSHDERVTVAIDKDRMEQVFLNIISNSVKYTEEGGTINVDAIKDGEEIKIKVIDNGMGIPDEDLGRIFERFYRVDKARSRAMGSSGLGLAISKQIVEEHHGSIEVTSKLGEGTTMTISLPVVTHRGIANIE